jgi:hypothetical protein
MLGHYPKVVLFDYVLLGKRWDTLRPPSSFAIHNTELYHCYIISATDRAFIKTNTHVCVCARVRACIYIYKTYIH